MLTVCHLAVLVAGLAIGAGVSAIWPRVTWAPRNWVHAPPCACPLHTLETTLTAEFAYERLTWRGFSASEVWKLLTLVQLNLRHRPRTIGHLRVSRGAEAELRLPSGTARCLLVVHVLAWRHAFFSDCHSHTWPHVVNTLWSAETRALRTQCKRTKCAL